MASTATVYAPGTRPPNYRDYVYLYTVGERCEAVVDGAPVGPLGRLFIVEPNKAVRVPWAAAEWISRHMSYTGVVMVNEVEKRDDQGEVTGTQLDIDKAKTESAALLEDSDRRRWRDYVQYVIDDKLNNKRVVPPPPDSIRHIMERRGYRLEDFGISIPGAMTPAAESRAAENAQNDQIKILTEQLARQTEIINALHSRLEAIAAASNPNPSTPDVIDQPEGDNPPNGQDSALPRVQASYRGRGKS